MLGGGMRRITWLGLAVMAICACTGALAEPEKAKPSGDDKKNVAEPQTSDKPEAEKVPSIQSSLGSFGDPGGYRALLESRGFTYSLTYIGEVLGNVSGGIKRGTIYEGRL